MWRNIIQQDLCFVFVILFWDLNGYSSKHFTRHNHGGTEVHFFSTNCNSFLQVTTFLQTATFSYKLQLFSTNQIHFLQTTTRNPIIFYKLATFFYNFANFFCNLATFLEKPQLFHKILIFCSTNHNVFLQSCNNFLQTAACFTNHNHFLQSCNFFLQHFSTNIAT